MDTKNTANKKQQMDVKDNNYLTSDIKTELLDSSDPLDTTTTPASDVERSNMSLNMMTVRFALSEFDLNAHQTKKTVTFKIDQIAHLNDTPLTQKKSKRKAKTVAQRLVQQCANRQTEKQTVEKLKPDENVNRHRAQLEDDKEITEPVAERQRAQEKAEIQRPEDDGEQQRHEKDCKIQRAKKNGKKQKAQKAIDKQRAQLVLEKQTALLAAEKESAELQDERQRTFQESEIKKKNQLRFIQLFISFQATHSEEMVIINRAKRQRDYLLAERLKELEGAYESRQQEVADFLRQQSLACKLGALREAERMVTRNAKQLDQQKADILQAHEEAERSYRHEVDIKGKELEEKYFSIREEVTNLGAHIEKDYHRLNELARMIEEANAKLNRARKDCLC